MNRPNMAVLAGLTLALMANFATAQDGDSSFKFDNVPIASGEEEPRVMRLEVVSGIDSGVANSGATLRVVGQLQESAGNFPLEWKLVEKITGQPNTIVAQGISEQPLTEVTVTRIVPTVTQPTEITLAFELTNSKGQHAAAGVNEAVTFMASPAQQPAGPTARGPVRRPNNILPASQPQQPEAPAVEQPQQPAGQSPQGANRQPELRLALDPSVVRGGPAEVKLTLIGSDPDNDPVTYSVRVRDGATLTPTPVASTEIRFPVDPVTEPTRLVIEVTAFDSRGGEAIAVTELQILPATAPAAPLVLSQPINGARPYRVRVPVNRPQNRLPTLTRRQDPNTGEWVFEPVQK